MSETLLSPSIILLFGRELTDITIDHKAYANWPPVQPGGYNRFLNANLARKDSRLARIFAFSYEGQYFELSAPAIFVVNGEGVDPQAPRPSQGGVPIPPAPGGIDPVGTAYQVGSFAPDVKVWAYDKSEFSIRLDISTGMLEEILLAAEVMDGDASFGFGGGKVGGGKVGGGKVGGGKVGGGKVGGGKVGGGKIGGGS